jgi:hypothetical protein
VLTRVLGRAVFGGRISIGEAWALTKGQIPALLGLALLTTLIMLAPLAPLTVLVIALFTAESFQAVGLVLIVGVLAYLVYVIFFAVRLALAAPAVVLERRGVIAGMSRSWRLTGPDFWRVLGILALTYVLVFIVSFVISIPFSIIAVAAAFGAGSGGAAGVVVSIITALGATISAMITYPVQAGVNGLLYADRRMRAEAFDLVLQTAAVDQQRLGWVPATADDLWDPANAAGPQQYGGA